MKAQKAIDLISPIPEEDFLPNIFTDGVGKCCVMGHLSRLTSENPNDYSADNCRDFEYFLGVSAAYGKEEVYKLRRISGDFLVLQGLNDSWGPYAMSISVVNNIPIGKYQQETPKERCLALLRDMVEAGY